MSSEYTTTIRLPNGKRSELGRLGLCVSIADEPRCFEFTNEELKVALELVKRHNKAFNNNEDGYRLDLFFTGYGPLDETEWISGTQLGIAETMVMKDFLRLAGVSQ